MKKNKKIKSFKVFSSSSSSNLYSPIYTSFFIRGKSYRRPVLSFYYYYAFTKPLLLLYWYILQNTKQKIKVSKFTLYYVYRSYRRVCCKENSPQLRLIVNMYTIYYNNNNIKQRIIIIYYLMHFLTTFNIVFVRHIVGIV